MHQGGGQHGAGAHLGQGQRQLVDQRAAPQGHDPLNGGDRPLARAHHQREELDDVGQLRLDAGPAPLDLPAEPPVAPRRPGQGRQQRGRDEGRGVDRAHERQEHAAAQGRHQARARPDQLLEAQLLVPQRPAGALQPPSDRRGRGAAPLQDPGGADEGADQGGADRAGVLRRGGRAQQARGPRAPVDVGRQPVREPDAAPPQGGQDQEDPDGGQEPRARPDRLRAHRSTRSSSGSRPRRSMRR